MATALYRRYRPESFAEMIGQQHVTDPLSAALRNGKIGHAYLFSGPRGCGKTTSARVLARCLNCAEGPTPTPCGSCPSCVELSRDGGGSIDVVEIDAASHGGVDDARDLRERATFAPARDRYKIFIIDEAHMVTPQGFNALLKIVEEPPPYLKFIFATTEPEKVLGTIRSRTHHYPFRLIAPGALIDYVQQLCDSEGVQVEEGVLPLLVRAGGGSARDTLSILDQLIAGAENGTVTLKLATALLGYTSSEMIDAVAGALAAGDGAAAFNGVNQVVQSGQDPRRFTEDLLQRLRDLIVIAATSVDGAGSVFRGVPLDQLERMYAQARSFAPGQLSYLADTVAKALDGMSGITAPRLQLELMIARALLGPGGAAGGAGATSGAGNASAGAGVPARPQGVAQQQVRPAPVQSAGMPSAAPTRNQVSAHNVSQQSRADVPANVGNTAEVSQQQVRKADIPQEISAEPVARDTEIASGKDVSRAQEKKLSGAISEFCEIKTDDISSEKSSFQGIGGGDVSRETYSQQQAETETSVVSVLSSARALLQGESAAPSPEKLQAAQAAQDARDARDAVLAAQQDAPQQAQQQTAQSSAQQPAEQAPAAQFAPQNSEPQPTAPDSAAPDNTAPANQPEQTPQTGENDAAAAELDETELQELWTEVLESLAGADEQALAAARLTRPLELRAGALKLGFNTRGDLEVFKTFAAKPAREIIQELLGINVAYVPARMPATNLPAAAHQPVSPAQPPAQQSAYPPGQKPPVSAWERNVTEEPPGKSEARRANTAVAPDANAATDPDLLPAVPASVRAMLEGQETAATPGTARAGFAVISPNQPIAAVPQSSSEQHATQKSEQTHAPQRHQPDPQTSALLQKNTEKTQLASAPETPADQSTDQADQTDQAETQTAPAAAQSAAPRLLVPATLDLPDIERYGESMIRQVFPGAILVETRSVAEPAAAPAAPDVQTSSELYDASLAEAADFAANYGSGYGSGDEAGYETAYQNVYQSEYQSDYAPGSGYSEQDSGYSGSGPEPGSGSGFEPDFAADPSANDADQDGAKLGENQTETDATGPATTNPAATADSEES